MLTRQEIEDRIKECELKGEFDKHVDEPDYNFIKVDENFPYIHKGFFRTIGDKLLKLFVINPFRVLCNKKIIKSKIIGKEKLKKLKRGIVTCNHVNIWDCVLLLECFKHRKIHFTAASFNNRADFLGKCMRAAGMLPLAESHSGMRKFGEAIEYYVSRKKGFVSFYPEQAMWHNYEKPRPFKNGAFHYAAKYNVPIIPTFITFVNTGELDKDGFEKKRFILNVLDPIYPNPKLSNKDNVDYLREKNFEAVKAKYEAFYDTKLEYTTITEDKLQ